MIASMTGFGRGHSKTDKLALTAEIRSVNSRYCEVSVRIPRQLNEFENSITNLVKQSITRGRISVQLQFENAVGEGLSVQIHEASVRAYMHLLNGLKTAAGIQEPVTLAHLLTFPDVIKSMEESTEASEELWETVKDAIQQGLVNLRSMRMQEGRALQDDLEVRIDIISKLLEEAEQRAPDRVTEARSRLLERLGELFEDDRIDRERIELEITLLADRLDVTEECVRLRSHLQLFLEAMSEEEPVGRKLNFITQEINREINTIGSKANDTRVAHLAVEMKEELEKIREQIQNVE